MNALLNIPEHTGCKNCGECCGVIPASTKEIREIAEYLQFHPEARKHAVAHANQITCPFRDEQKKKCLVYPVRPIICRMFGVCEGPMQCPNGNSAQIDGMIFMPAEIEIGGILNFMDWQKVK
jgi:hypothetical protein